jgi:hypothetical protein
MEMMKMTFRFGLYPFLGPSWMFFPNLYMFYYILIIPPNEANIFVRLFPQEAKAHGDSDTAED